MLIGVMASAQTEVRIHSEYDLFLCTIELLDDDGKEVPLNDMRVDTPNDISLLLEPGTIYTLIIDNSIQIILHPVPDSMVASAEINEIALHSGHVTIEADEITFSALKSKKNKRRHRI